MTAKTTKSGSRNGANPVFSFGVMIFLIMLVCPDRAFSQRQRSWGRSGYNEESVLLPDQRTPLPLSEINLKEILFKIVYESFRETEGQANWEICLIRADGSNLVNLTKTPEIDEFYPHASPDGTKICFEAEGGNDPNAKSHDVYTMNADGTGRSKIAENARQPCWSPDGKLIAYLKGEYGRYNNSSWSNNGLEIYNVQTQEIKQHPNSGLRMLFNLGWSPDGKWFVATSRGGRGSNISFKADDATEAVLSIHGCRPDISPDGGRIAWGRSDWDLDIGTLDLNSSGNNVSEAKAVVACDRGFKVYHVDWSPDGRYLTFSYGPSRGDQAVGRKAAGWNICVCELKTGKWTQITMDGNHNKEPDWVLIQ